MFGLGVIELLVLFLVLGGVVLALRRGSSARKWVIGGLLILLAVGVAVALVGVVVAPSHVVLQRATANAAQLDSIAVELPQEAGLGSTPSQIVQTSPSQRAGYIPIAGWAMILLAVFGLAILVAGVIGLAWLYKHYRIAAIAVSVVGGLAFIMIVVGLPFVQQIRERERREQAQANLEALGRALHNQEQPVARRLRPMDARAISPRGTFPVVAPRPHQEPPVPEWVVSGTTLESGLAVVASDQYASAGGATANAIDKARRVVRVRLRQSDHSIHLPDEIRQTFVPSIRQRHLERIYRSTGKHQFRVYRQHLLIDVSPDALNRIAQLGRGRLAAHRVTIVSVIALALTGLASVVAGFVRTGHRRRWGFVGAAFVGGALLLSVFAAIA